MDASSVWTVPIEDAPGDVRMMEGYLDPRNSPATVTVSGLAPDAYGYNVYVYTDGDNGTATRSASYQISGPGSSLPAATLTDAADTNFSGTYILGNNATGNYLVFFISTSEFTLTATPGPASDNNPRAPINGIQIVPVIADFSIWRRSCSR